MVLKTNLAESNNWHQSFNKYYFGSLSELFWGYNLFSRAFTLVFFSLILGRGVLADITRVSPTFDRADVISFIQQAYTPTYDCPTSALNTQIDIALTSSSLTPQQTLQLTSMKTHGLICAGNFTEAQSILQRMLANEQSDRSAQYYASAIFQYGFVYDVNENPERCDYYMLARDSAKNKYVDVHLSASLGYITECMKSDMNAQVFELYQLLVMITQMKSPAALAHAYNRVGYFYARNGQQSLAASQYQKAFKTAENIYTDENLLSLLGSLITSLQAINDLSRTKEALDKFIDINDKSGTRHTLFLQYLFQAAYSVSIKDYAALEITLANWNDLTGDDNNAINQGLHRWYVSELCYFQNDIQCLRDFLESENSAPSTYKNYISRSKSYSRFIVEANMLIGNKQGSIAAFEKYQTKMATIQRTVQDNYATFDLTSLHDKILNLESSLKIQQQKRTQMIWTLCGVLLITLLVVLWFVRRKYLDSQSYDNLTGVLTKTAFINKLVHVAKPNAHCTNALVIFDIANFTEVNLSLGFTQSAFVIGRIANTLNKITRSSDLLGRFSPEQFILCLVDIEENAAQAFFERVKDALTNTFADHNNHHTISVDSSMSIYCSTGSFDDINEILENMLLSLSMKADLS
ncbi:MAG: diguanylate cyclase (GGDEF)-like protein [Kangiellaceae bacterium]